MSVNTRKRRHGTDIVDLIHLTLPRLRVDNKVLQHLDLYEEDHPGVLITLRIIQDDKCEYISATLEPRRQMPKQLWLSGR